MNAEFGMRDKRLPSGASAQTRRKKKQGGMGPSAYPSFFYLRKKVYSYWESRESGVEFG